MLADKKPSELDDWTLMDAWNKCGQVMAQREKARSHDKFKKMEFPPPNPKFIEIMNSIEDEMKKRKLL